MKPNDAPIEVLQIPMMTRLAPVTTVNAESRTVELVWTTGAGVMRYDWYNDRYYIEELSLDPKHVRMGRLESGRAPLLNTHWRYDLAAVMGVIRQASLEAGQGLATVEFSKREDVEPYYQDVVDKIIGNVSVGYSVYEYDRIPPAADGQPWRYVAIDWEPTEISLVPIGADADCGVRSDSQDQPGKPPVGRMAPCKFNTRSNDVSQPPAAAGIQSRKETTMEGDQNTSAAPSTVATAALLEAARAEGARLEGERQTGIREAVRLGGLEPAFADQLIARSDMTAAEAGMAVLREKAKRDEAVPTRSAANIVTVTDETETRRAMMAEAIVHRLNPKAQISDGARQYRHMSLLRLAEESLIANGVGVRGLSGIEIAARAMHSTSDFPAILANVLNKRLRQAYQESERTYTRWARRAPNAPDFKQIQVTQLGGAPDLLKVNESGEFQYGTIADGKETYGVLTYGRIVAVNRQTIVNDDLRALDRLVAGFGASASRLENRLVYAQLTGNPVMSDGTALFHADHGNLAAAGAIATATLGAGRGAMRVQKGLQSEELNIVPAFLIVPAALEQVAYQYTSANYVPAKSSDVNEFRSGGRTALEPIVEPVLDAVSASQWYLAANSGQVDTVEYCYLDGSEGVWIENEIGFDIDGMKVKARLDFAAKAVDHRGLYRNG
ncbi:prohead protease/major capsid protein fusion protein [Herbaspirillum sp. ST 5-3]|uniref:prohead protease/major capsid protein fusion protein n=1 Tax=Oxalobacteraceae TaxID=75682 RepID=UPI0010A2BC00|nr:prohead protease/major capsid protein fusion protein [Herbaspirillum sp. ST 5-3]